MKRAGMCAIAFVVVILPVLGPAYAQVKLPSGRQISCTEAWKIRDGVVGPGAKILLAKDDADRQARRAKILEETKVHIAKMKADWAKKSAEEQKTLWREVAWVTALNAIKWKAQHDAGRGLSDVDKKMAAELASRSVSLLDFVAKGTILNQVSSQDVILMPISTLIGIATKGSWPGIVLDVGVGAINVAALAGDVSLTNASFSGQIEQLEKLAETLAERMTSTNAAALQSLESEIKKSCPGPR